MIRLFVRNGTLPAHPDTYDYRGAIGGAKYIAQRILTAERTGGNDRAHEEYTIGRGMLKHPELKPVLDSEVVEVHNEERKI